MSDTGSVVIEADQGFTHSVGIQLARFAGIAIAGLAAFIYLLWIIAGEAGSTTSGNAIDVENNSITIALREEPPNSMPIGQQMPPVWSCWPT